MTQQPLTPETIFITRYVASHDVSLPWYERFFGRPADDRPMPSCHEWRLGEGVLFQVIEDPARQGETQFAFRVASLDGELTRLRQAGIDIPEPADVGGFSTLRYAETADPEGVATGLLDGE